jgi:hypothetical protein
MTAQTVDRRGVIRRNKMPTPIVGNGETVGRAIAETTRTEAFDLAMANKHKPWARRWLRTNFMGKFL